VPEGPLYQRLFETLKDAIERHVYAVDSILPTEAELSEQFGLSRSTVREALRRLADLGYVARRQGSGTKVISTSSKFSYVHAIQSLSELFQYTRDSVVDIDAIETIKLSPEEGHDLNIAAGTRWLRISGIRRGTPTGEVLCCVFVYAHVRFSGLLHDIRTHKGPIYALIESRSGEIVASAIQEISAKPMPASVARRLEQPNGVTALRVIRRYLDSSGGPMMVAINWHPAENFTYVMELQRDTD
jgi:DNA-binding GntR family transcriptional regulator